MFWLSYECFSIFCNAFLKKSAIFSHNSCGMSDENLVLLEFKYLQNKKWQKQGVKKCQNKEKLQNILIVFILLRKLIKTCNLPSKLAVFNIYRFCSICEALWMQIFCISSAASVTSRTKRSFCFQKIPATAGLNRKKQKKHDILAFKPLLQKIQLA